MRGLLQQTEATNGRLYSLNCAAVWPDGRDATAEIMAVVKRIYSCWRRRVLQIDMSNPLIIHSCGQLQH